MKRRLLELLQCPECGRALSLQVKREEPGLPLSHMPMAPRCTEHCALNDCAPERVSPDHCVSCYGTEIVDGQLRCEAGHIYPIVDGIPRLLPSLLLAEVLRNHYPDRAAETAGPAAAQLPPGAMDSSSRKKLNTLRAFGYQWTTFLENFEYFESIFLSFVHPFLGPNDFRDRLILDVGCGSGRPASVACSLGAEVVAMDLSEAVRTAYGASKTYPLLHVVQGDAYALPFPARFDLVYSVGVIQHLPDPAKALKSIARAVPAGHRLIIWVYGARELWYRPIDWLRRLTTKFPFRALHALSFVLAIASELFLLLPYRLLSRWRATRALAERIPGNIYARFPFRENVLGWFDRLGAPVTHYFTQAEVAEMLASAGFKTIRVVPRPGASASWVAEGIRMKD